MSKLSKNQQIVSAATELFTNISYCKVSLRLVASAAKVSHSLVHKNYGTKKDLFRIVLDEQCRDFIQAIRIDPSSSQIALSAMVLSLVSNRDHKFISLLQQVANTRELYDLLETGCVKQDLESLLDNFNGVELPGTPEFNADAFIMLLVSVLFSEPAAGFLLALGWESGRVSTAQSNVMSGFLRLVYSLNK